MDVDGYTLGLSGKHTKSYETSPCDFHGKIHYSYGHVQSQIVKLPEGSLPRVDKDMPICHMANMLLVYSHSMVDYHMGFFTGYTDILINFIAV